ncbi:von Willebrand factor A domain-containing protein 5B1 [Sinocyclocheilus anshuiensis]|uniref:von Willebrand factor A domain-containing protein 5B1 n=1 Tax=Sinocyclocheilus anshuiensis TaxID=1608454 RepID=UPI0007BAA23D|nr:PREDICTED: von Willebrand factor A domain-containing protein 5B1 [Sinocyclocheilus anshuiensis]
MPGLINKSKWSALPLSISDISSCVRGYTLAMTASLTYENIEDHPIEGIFIYPLDEGSVVVGFEAMIGSQIITVQVKDKTKIDDCFFDCCNANGTPQNGGGHIVLDEDQERTVLVVSLGVIPPLETINILVSTSSELRTLPKGGIRVTSPPVCSPRVQRSVKEEQAFSPSTARRRDQHHCSVGAHEQTASGVCLAAMLEEETINSIDYEFNFHLEIRGPYLLAGVESPSHAIRADADPSARSATNIVVTLADKYTYDCPVEILIYPSEPHLPHVLIEDGDMTPEEYDEHLKGRSDYIKATKKDCSNEKTVDIIRKRLHKDILHNPVVMLNFCPNLSSTTSDLRSIQGEFIFLIDRSGSMSGVNINRVKDAMVVILKSLFPACLFNIVGFGSKFKTLFVTSQSYNEESLALACEHVKKIRADMGGTNILAPLNWILRQPMQRGHPRLLFLLTDGAVSNTGKVIELLRSHARFTRCYTFGIGQGVCRRLVLGLAAVSRGTAEFLAEGERLQPKMIKSLKKSMTSVLTDISIEWLYPETKEILLSPVGVSCLFPGDRLIGYSVVCDTSRYHSNPKSDKRKRYSMMRSNESASSVFYHSQEEDAGKVSSDGQGPHRDNQVSSLFDGCQETMSESSPISTEQDIMGTDTATSPRRRAYSTNQIVDYNPMKKAYTPSDPSSVVGKNPLRRAKVQELIGQTHPDHGAHWKMDYQPQLASLCATSSRGRPITAHKPLVQQPEGLQGESKIDQTHPGPVVADGSRSSTDSPSLGSTGDADGYTHQLCEVETPQDPHAPEFKASHGKGDCKAVISGLLCGKPMRWEVAFDIQPYLKGREREEKVHEDLWNETFHHLAGSSIIQDFEHMADKECEIEHGSGRRYQLYAIHTSKACNILSKYTAFVPIDLDSNEYLPTFIEYSHPGEDHKRSPHCSSRSSSRKNRGYSVGLGRSQSGGLPGQEDAALCYNVDNASQSSYKSPSSSSWERCSSSEASQRNASVTSDPSQRSVESLFSASKLSLSRTRLLTKAARGFMSRSQSKISNSVGESENDNKDYIPLVSLQLSCGAFMLDSALCDAINVPMDKLKWTSPFTSHRISLTHVSHSGSRRSESLEVHHGSSPPPKDSDLNSECEELVSRTSSSSYQARSPRMEGEPSLLSGFSSMSTEAPLSPINSLHDSGRESESEIAETPWLSSPGILQRAVQDPEGMVWATAVALAWLEHSSASYFIEWELIAAKASMWLDEQIIPEGRDLAAVKAAANQLFIILRHWDENLQLNMLCYNPNSM